MSELKKIFCFNNGGSVGFLEAVAVAEDGTCLAGHICSHEGHMKHDLGITSDWKHDNYNQHYGAGNWELEWVPDPRAHVGLNEALRLNSLQAQQADEEEVTP